MPPKIIFLTQTDSTNNYIRRNLSALKTGSIVWAEQQTAGRGKGMRQWQSTTGSLCFSVLLRIPKPIPSSKNPSSINIIEIAPLATQIAAVAVCNGFNLLGLTPSIKWPNDIVFGNLKAAGILIDLVHEKSSYAAIVGIGINAFQNSHQLSAICEHISTSKILKTSPATTSSIPTSIAMQLNLTKKLFGENKPPQNSIQQLATKALDDYDELQKKEKANPKNTSKNIVQNIFYEAFLKEISARLVQLFSYTPFNSGHCSIQQAAQLDNLTGIKFKKKSPYSAPLINPKTQPEIAKNNEPLSQKSKNSWLFYWREHSLIVGKQVHFSQKNKNHSTNKHEKVKVLGITENGTMQVQLNTTKKITEIPLSVFWNYEQ